MFGLIFHANSFSLIDRLPELARANLGCVALLSGYRGYVLFDF
ncbi:hypothetical protein VCEM1676A_000428 [Vibrio cholerae O1 str. EM-1676A]|nr:hypothetical protein VCEM1676A_000428 [Vibrio cholerae O1 str. EM-1676A]